MISYKQAVLLCRREAAFSKQKILEIFRDSAGKQSSSVAEGWPLPCQGQA